jgi:hypothetical protein
MSFQKMHLADIYVGQFSKPSNLKPTNQKVPSDMYDGIIYDCLNSELHKYHRTHFSKLSPDVLLSISSTFRNKL